MSSRRTDSSSTSVSGSYKGARGEVKHENQSNTPFFPYGCRYGCNRQNVVSNPDNSCGRPSCNKAWEEAHGGLRKAGRAVKKGIGL